MLKLVEKVYVKNGLNFTDQQTEINICKIKSITKLSRVKSVQVQLGLTLVPIVVFSYFKIFFFY